MKRKSPIDWKAYIAQLRELDKVIDTHTKNGHPHSAKKHQEKKDALLKEIETIKKQRGI